MKLDEFKQNWAKLKPGTQKKVFIALVAGVFVSLVAIGQMNKGDQKSNIALAPVAPQQITMDNRILDKTITAENDKQKSEIADLRKRLEEFSKNGNAVPPAGTQPATATGPAASGQKNAVQEKTAAGQQPPKQAQSLPPIPKQQTPYNQNAAPRAMVPPPPPMAGGNNMANRGGVPNNGQVVSPVRPVETTIGDIEVMTVSKAPAQDTATKDKKKVVQQLYLPTGSFMEATLLSGLYAPTTDGARGNPVPVLIRVKAPSQLPNDVKANLRGCFAVAEGVGNLADDRAHLRILNLSCITKNGGAVIDQKVKGYVSDSDGFIGLKGRVVSRMGSAIARSLVAGFFGGFGEALKSSTQQNTLTAIGTTVSNPIADLDKISMAGLGQGLSDATKQIQQFYLELAKQSVPVIEILPRKKVTIVISEGVKLDVKPLYNNL